MSAGGLRDPFSLTADPRLYVPRAATERALAALLAAVEEERGAIALTGPGGLGKTLLLRLLGERLVGRCLPVPVPVPSLSPDDLGAWVLAGLGEPAGDAPAETLLAAVRRLDAQGPGILLLVDDGGALPRDTARWLGTVAAASAGRLSVVVAAGDHVGASTALAALAPAVSVRLSDPMDEAECAAYVEARLFRARVSEHVRARFSPAAVRRLHAISGGNPRRLHLAASDLLRGGSGQVAEDLFVAGADTPARPASDPGSEDA